LGGSASPPIVGWFKDATGSFSGGLYALAIFGLMAAIVAALCVRETPVALAPQALEAATGRPSNELFFISMSSSMMPGRPRRGRHRLLNRART